MRYLPHLSLLAISPRESELEPINTIPSRFSLNVAISRGKRPKGVSGVLWTPKNREYSNDMEMSIYYLVSWVSLSYVSYWFFDSRGGRIEKFKSLSTTAKGVRVIIHIILGYMLYSFIWAVVPASLFE